MIDLLRPMYTQQVLKMINKSSMEIFCIEGINLSAKKINIKKK